MGAFGRMLAQILCIFCSVGFAACEDVATWDACAVSGNGRAGLSILPLGLRGIRFKGTMTGGKKLVFQSIPESQ